MHSILPSSLKKFITFSFLLLPLATLAQQPYNVLFILVDGSKAVALFNISDEEQVISITADKKLNKVNL